MFPTSQTLTLQDIFDHPSIAFGTITSPPSKNYTGQPKSCTAITQQKPTPGTPRATVGRRRFRVCVRKRTETHPVDGFVSGHESSSLSSRRVLLRSRADRVGVGSV